MSQKPQITLSLRLKLILLLISVPLISLALYSNYTIELFIKDKVAYIFDSSLQIAQTSAKQVEIELNSQRQGIQSLRNSVNPESRQFNQLAQNIFKKLGNFEFVYLYEVDKKGDVKLNDSLVKFPREIQQLELTSDQIQEILVGAIDTGSVILEYKDKNFFIAADAVAIKKAESQLVTICVFRSSTLFETFALAGNYKKFLISEQKKILIQPKIWSSQDNALQNVSPEFFAPVIDRGLPEGVREMNVSGLPQMLMAYSKIGEWNSYLVTLVNKDKATETLTGIIAKSILYGAILLLIVVLIGMFSSRQLTISIRKLVEVTDLISQGQFDLKVDVKSSDEVGYLAKKIEWMAGEVNKLVNETAEKSRLETEIQTVKLVQDKLIPDWNLFEDNFHICSFMEAAEVCGGDWFHYSRQGDRLMLFLGDATGHGAGPAMLTAAAKAVTTVIETSEHFDPAMALEILNKAIFNTAKGSIQMTFFAAELNLSTGVIKYANAGHEFPVVVPKQEQVKKKNLRYLMSKSSRRLGEELDSEYESNGQNLNPGDQLIIFTDGVFELVDATGKEFTEGEFIRTVTKTFAGFHPLDQKLGDFKATIDKFRSTDHLPDDLTLMLVQYEPNAST